MSLPTIKPTTFGEWLRAAREAERISHYPMTIDRLEHDEPAHAVVMGGGR